MFSHLVMGRLFGGPQALSENSERETPGKVHASQGISRNEESILVRWKAMLGNSKTEDASTPVAAPTPPATDRPTLLSRLTAGALSKQRADEKPIGAESSAPEPPQPRAPSLIERILEGEKAHAAQRNGVVANEAPQDRPEGSIHRQPKASATEKRRPQPIWFGEPIWSAAALPSQAATNEQEMGAARDQPTPFQMFTRTHVATVPNPSSKPASTKQKQADFNQSTRLSLEEPSKRHGLRCLDGTKRWECPAFTSGTW